jgi:hypothetical protein
MLNHQKLHHDLQVQGMEKGTNKNDQQEAG